MIEIINKQRGPIQLMLRSKTKANGFDLATLKGFGAGQNRMVISEEEMTPQISRLENLKLITTNTLDQ